MQQVNESLGEQEINQTVIERESSDLFCILIYMMDASIAFPSSKAVFHMFTLTVYAL